MWDLIGKMKYLLCVITLSLLFYHNTAASQPDDTFNIVVEVNDQIITNYEISQRLTLLNVLGAKSISRESVIEKLINEKLISQNATSLNLLPNKSEIDAEVKVFADRGNLTKERLLNYLDLQNISETTLLSYIKSGLTQRKVIQKKFANNIIISELDLDLEINTNNSSQKNKSDQINYITLSLPENKNDKKNLKLLNLISKKIDNCFDLQSEAKKYQSINMQIFNTKKNRLHKDVNIIIDNLDIYESKIISHSDKGNYLIMLCSRNSKINNDKLNIIRNKIFLERINKIEKAYIQELRGEAFIDFK
jgi:peptidyl-prolyl cis-trans isomerase SurA